MATKNFRLLTFRFYCHRFHGRWDYLFWDRAVTTNNLGHVILFIFILEFCFLFFKAEKKKKINFLADGGARLMALFFQDVQRILLLSLLALFQQKSSCRFESSVVALRRPDARPLAIRWISVHRVLQFHLPPRASRTSNSWLHFICNT